MHLAGKQGKGYRRSDFTEAWAAYLAGENTPSPQTDAFDPNNRTTPDGSKTYPENRSEQHPPAFGSQTDPNALKAKGLFGCSDRKPRLEAKGPNGQGGAAYRTRYLDRQADAATRQALAGNRRCALCGEPAAPGDSLWPAVDDDNKPVLLHAVCMSQWQGDLKRRRQQ